MNNNKENQKKRNIKIPSEISSIIKEKELFSLQKKLNVKRTIRAPRKLITAKKEVKKLPIAKKGIVKSASPINLAVKINNISKKKRTLKLNLNGFKITSQAEKELPAIDVSINQNSAFFYEPSFFEKFNVDITDTTQDNGVTLEIDKNIVPLSSNESAADINTAKEENVEIITSKEDNVISPKKEEKKNFDLSKFQDDDDTDIDLEILNKFDDSKEIAELLDINLNQDSTISNTESNSNIFSSINNSLDENENIEAADSFIKSNDMIVGKLVENSTSNNNFSTVKRNIFSAATNVFKKISFDDTNIVKTENDIFNNNIVNNIKLDSINTTANGNSNNIVINTDEPLVSIEAKAKNVSTPTIDESLLTKTENNSDIDINSSVLTSVENNSENNEFVERILKESKKNKKQSKESSSEVKKKVSKNIENPINVTLDSLDENYIEESNTNTNDSNTNIIENSKEQENIEKQENTTISSFDFSIEDYFGINDDDFDKKYNIEDTNNDIQINNEEITLNNNENLQEDSFDDIDLETFEKTFLDQYSNNYSDSELLNDLENIQNQNINKNTNSITAIDTSLDEIIPKEIIDESSNDKSISEENVSKDSTNQKVITNNETISKENTYSNEKILENFNNSLELLNKTFKTANKKIEKIEKKSNTENEITALESLNDVSINNYNNIKAQEKLSSENEDSLIDSLLSSALFNNENIDDELKDQLLNEVLNVETDTDYNEQDEDVKPTENSGTNSLNLEDTNSTDFFKIIDSLSKTISELKDDSTTTTEGVTKIVNDVKNINEDDDVKIYNIESNSEETIDSTGKTVQIPVVKATESEKAFSILIDQDDIFSISIKNEKYEIVADFNGISVLSDNVHISTPKNNFYIKVGEKYIEIHNHQTHFIVQTDFEDVEFTNAINNITFTKKNNIIELNVKEAFKLSSAVDKVELSMLNTSVADINSISSSQSQNSSLDFESSSALDNNTLLISEETQKVYLPYKIEDVVKKLKAENSEYTSIEEVVEKEYTVPLSEFNMPIISRFKEAYKFMRSKEKSSVYAAIDLALELMFNSNLNPAVIRASKDLKELNNYLDCLYENELDKFDCFKIVYKVLPKVQ